MESPAHNIETVTFTGLDSYTDPSDIAALHHRYPATEFGILISGNSGNPDHPRYPSEKVISWWKDFGQDCGIPLALHLCGPYAKKVTADPHEPDLIALCDGFSRVQVNSARYDYTQIEKFANAVGCNSVIVQHREPFYAKMPLAHPKVDYLHDLSGGRGHCSIDHWPPPASPGVFHGYAGGISPDNITAVAEFTAHHSGFSIWVDMETGVRDNSDCFDAEKAGQVCEALFPG